MPDCIFDKRLKQQARDQSIQSHWREVDLYTQAVLESDALDIDKDWSVLTRDATEPLAFPILPGFAGEVRLGW